MGASQVVVFCLYFWRYTDWADKTDSHGFFLEGRSNRKMFNASKYERKIFKNPCKSAQSVKSVYPLTPENRKS